MSSQEPPASPVAPSTPVAASSSQNASDRMLASPILSRSAVTIGKEGTAFQRAPLTGVHGDPAGTSLFREPKSDSLSALATRLRYFIDKLESEHFVFSSVTQRGNFLKLSRQFLRAFSSQMRFPRVVRLEGPTFIIGDLHARFRDLQDYFTKIHGPLAVFEPSLSAHNVLFLGDLSERGPHSLYVALYVMALVAQGHVSSESAGRIILTRGNHEDKEMNEVSSRRTLEGDIVSFFTKTLKKSPHETVLARAKCFWKLINAAYDVLPDATIIQNTLTLPGEPPEQVWCCHAGVPRRPPADVWPADLPRWMMLMCQRDKEGHDYSSKRFSTVAFDDRDIIDQPCEAETFRQVGVRLKGKTRRKDIALYQMLRDIRWGDAANNKYNAPPLQHDTIASTEQELFAAEDLGDSDDEPAQSTQEPPSPTIEAEEEKDGLSFDKSGFASGARGTVFSATALSEFLKEGGFCAMVRGHEWKAEGFDASMVIDGGQRLFTVHSCTHFDGSKSQDTGAMLYVGLDRKREKVVVPNVHGLEIVDERVYCSMRFQVVQLIKPADDEASSQFSR
eukprot:NODE_881_length_2017_cov_97.158395_g834_i0.p1 GENE.NODE_881_length_2017_cov_97.158395_g834_i0~~NODE_881_length_2017_cov_97.158395_g834_i0.p1  ORF type:complete len:561 (+),score=87.09 NODE_881_length_2017_cov_97.158395_g834_i0:120-1802(+)